MQPYRLGLYEKAMPPALHWRQKLEACRAAGFDWMEISIDETEEKRARLDWTDAEFAELEQAMAETGVPIETMCLSAHRKYPLGSHDAAVRAESLRIMEQAVYFASRIGIKIIQLAGYDVYYEQGDGETRALFLENLRQCVHMAAAQGVLLGFETMETPFMDTVEKAMQYVNLIHSPYLGVYPDVGNLTNAEKLYGTSVLADIGLGWGHIFAAHLKETQPGVYRDMRFGEGHTDYVPAVRALYGMGVRMFTGEFWYDGGEDYAATLREANAFLRGKIEEAITPGAKEVAQ